MSTTHPFIPESAPESPQVDHRWQPSDFGSHLAAEDIEMHASPRFGGSPVLSATLGVAIGTVGLQLADREGLIEP